MTGFLAVVALALWGVSLITRNDGLGRVGTLGDIALVVQCAASLPVLVALRHIFGEAGRRELYVPLIGAAGMSGLAVVQLLHLTRVIGLGREAPVAIVAVALIGVWLAHAGWQGQRLGVLPGRVAAAGAVALIGVSLLAAGLAVLVTATVDLSGQSLAAHAPAVAVAAAGLLIWGVSFASWMLCLRIKLTTVAITSEAQASVLGRR